MARRVCTTQPGDGACCRAFSQGVRSGQNFTFTDSRGNQRCGSCSIVQSRSKRHPGKNVFQFKFQKNQACGIVSGCAALQGNAGGGLVLGGTQTPAISGF